MKQRRKPQVASDDVRLYVGGRIMTVEEVKRDEFVGSPNREWFRGELSTMQALVLEKSEGRRQESQLYEIASDVLFEAAYPYRNNAEITRFLNRNARLIRKNLVTYTITKLNEEGLTIQLGD